jgi:hypothetical protein
MHPLGYPCPLPSHLLSRDVGVVLRLRSASRTDLAQLLSADHARRVDHPFIVAAQTSCSRARRATARHRARTHRRDVQGRREGYPYR